MESMQPLQLFPRGLDGGGGEKIVPPPLPPRDQTATVPKPPVAPKPQVRTQLDPALAMGLHI